jgi:hypothetical protein
MLTTDTITDDQILALIRDPRVTVSVANDCRRALGWLYPGSLDYSARARCAEILNARNRRAVLNAHTGVHVFPEAGES